MYLLKKKNTAIKTVLTISTAAVISVFASTSAMADNATNVYFKGEIVAGACGLAPDSIDQTIQLGQHPTHLFKAKGDRSIPVPFNIKLTDCDTSTLKSAQFTFLSNADASGELFNVQGGATGFGVRILYNGTPLKNGSPTAATTLINGTNAIKFAAAYEMNSTTPVTAGNAESWALLRVSYQ